MNLYILGPSEAYQGWGFVYDIDSGLSYALPPIGEEATMVTLLRPTSSVVMEAAIEDPVVAESILVDYDDQLVAILG